MTVRIIQASSKKEFDLQHVEPMMTDSSDDFLNQNKEVKDYFRIKNQVVREFLAELFGTWLLVLFINGCIAQDLFNKRDNNPSSLISINFTCGFAVTFAILVVGKVSGAHLNPAVSLSLMFQRKLSVFKFFIYVLAQMLGGFIAAATVYAVYYDVLSRFDNGTPSQETASIFATYPNKDLSFFGAIFDQTFATSILIVGVLAITDKQNQLSQGVVAGYVGMLVFMIGTTFCYNCGYAINPARDFGPRLFSYLAGWDFVFSDRMSFYMVPIIGPMMGGILGTVVYCMFVSNHWPSENYATLSEIKTTQF